MVWEQEKVQQYENERNKLLIAAGIELTAGLPRLACAFSLPSLPALLGAKLPRATSQFI
jgi:hypothetical protein